MNLICSGKKVGLFKHGKEGTVFLPCVLQISQLNLGNINWLSHDKYPDRKNLGMCWCRNRTHDLLCCMQMPYYYSNLIKDHHATLLSIYPSMEFFYRLHDPSDPSWSLLDLHLSLTLYGVHHICHKYMTLCCAKSTWLSRHGSRRVDFCMDDIRFRQQMQMSVQIPGGS